MSKRHSSSIYLDGGNALFKNATVQGGAQKRYELAKARLVATTLASIAPDAINIGAKDLAAGVDFVYELGRETRLNWLSSNIRRADGTAPFPLYRRVKWGELEVVVVGVTAPLKARGKKRAFAVIDPVAAINEALARAGEADLYVALSDLGYREEHLLARALPRLGMIIGGGEGNRLMKEPLRLGSTLLLRVADRGRHLGVFELIAPEDGLSRPVQWKTQRAGGEGALDDFARQLSIARPGATAQNDPVLKAVEELSQKAKEQEPVAGAATYRSTVLYLNGKVGSDKEVQRAVAEFKRAQREEQARLRSAAANFEKQQLQELKPKKPETEKTDKKEKPGNKPLSKPAASKPAPAPKKVARLESWNLGSMRCRSCHQREFTLFNYTGHSRTGSLIPIDKLSDKNCRGCHFSRLEMGRGASSEGFVSCERCHGMGSGHPEKVGGKPLSARTGVPTVKGAVAREVCEGCHRGEHNEVFIFEQDYQKIRCDRSR